MMPNMRGAVRLLGGRRVSGQIVQSQVLDNEAVENVVTTARATLLLTPMPPRKIAMKPEGERAWKWWEAVSETKLKLGWSVKPDRDDGRLYRVMSEADWGAARVYNYDVAERPQ